MSVAIITFACQSPKVRMDAANEITSVTTCSEKRVNLSLLAGNEIRNITLSEGANNKFTSVQIQIYIFIYILTV